MVHRRDNPFGLGAAVKMVFFLFLLSEMLLGGCGPQKESPSVVRMGILRGDLHQLAYYIAREKGFFSEQGIEVKETTFNAGPEEMSAFSTGELDLGYIGIGAVATFVGRGMAEVKIVAQANAEGTAIVARNGLEAEDAAALKGRNVAVPGYSTIQDFLLRIALKKAGVSVNDVTIAVVNQEQITSSLAGGQIDAAVIAEPYPSIVQAQNAGRVLVTSAKIWPHHPCCMLVVNTAFLKENSDAVQRAVNAHVKAMKYIKDNPLEAADMAHLFTGLSQDVSHAAMKDIEFSYKPDVKGIQRYIDFLASRGVIKAEDAAGFARSIVDTRFLPGGS
jgi:sulfonate transport system substrate-binding protein